LLRWRHPTLGEISPSEFIPIIEQTAMAKATTAWVMETALKQLSTWCAAGLDLQLSVNVSAANLIEPDFMEQVTASLARHALPTERLELEITESAVMEDAGQALTALRTLADAGIRLAIDDFGTGYSSLSYLQRLPAQVVKIDQSFIRSLAVDERQQCLVPTMIMLSHDLGYHVVAEGVETVEALELLATARCDEAQGYLFGRPMTATDFILWCRSSEFAPRSTSTL
jgi:EAL domain-containing protein (putative c-di-GMP-specific phosphodiesterase class I)